MKFLARFIRETSGGAAMEYGLMLAIIATVVVAGFTAISSGLLNAFFKAIEGLNL